MGEGEENEAELLLNSTAHLSRWRKDGSVRAACPLIKNKKWARWAFIFHSGLWQTERRKCHLKISVLNVGKPHWQAERAQPQGAAHTPETRVLLSKQRATTAATSVHSKNACFYQVTRERVINRRAGLNFFGYQGKYHSENKTVKAQSMSKQFPDTRTYLQAVGFLPRSHCNSQYTPFCRRGDPPRQRHSESGNFQYVSMSGSEREDLTHLKNIHVITEGLS